MKVCSEYFSLRYCFLQELGMRRSALLYWVVGSKQLDHIIDLDEENPVYMGIDVL
jgi:hypothetical protein